jgi:Protein of unknown function (DUF4232)
MLDPTKSIAAKELPMPPLIATHPSQPGGRPRLVRFASVTLAGVALVLAFTWAGLVSTASASPIPPCAASQLSARITFWQGAAGSRIANVLLVNTSFVKCTIRNYPRVQLVDRPGTVMINGLAPSTTGALHTLLPLGFIKTEVQTGNYCGPAYTAPVTLAFGLPGSLGRVIAIPLSEADTMGVPPCLGTPGSAGHISMHAWHT